MSKMFAVEKAVHYLYIGIASVVCVIALAIVGKIAYSEYITDKTGAMLQPDEVGEDILVLDEYAPDTYEMPWKDQPEPEAENASPESEIIWDESEVLPYGKETLPGDE